MDLPRGEIRIYSRGLVAYGLPNEVDLEVAYFLRNEGLMGKACMSCKIEGYKYLQCSMVSLDSKVSYVPSDSLSARDCMCAVFRDCGISQTSKVKLLEIANELRRTLEGYINYPLMAELTYAYDAELLDWM